MDWIGYQDIANALSRGAVPRGRIYDSEHSTPDVYGRAIQQYISLWEAQQIGDDTGDAVRTWRGFLTLLALRGHLELPLVWTRVNLAGDMQDWNIFYMALGRPVVRADRLLYPNAPDWKWDGKVFYALQWAPPNAVPEDILLYSPYTLVYPVAGWRKKLEAILRRGDRDGLVLSRFFAGTGFRMMTDPAVLNKGEPEMLYYFLEELLFSFTTPEAAHEGGPNETQKTISAHINRYMQALKQNLGVVPGGVFRLCPFPPAKRDPVQEGWIPDILQSSVQIGEGRYFADQICFFKTDNYPFADHEYENCYRIENAPKGDSWYAFLPIHPDQRGACVENGLARSVRMVYSGVRGSGRNPGTEKITASMRLPTGQIISRDYTVSHSPTMQKDMAVSLNDGESVLQKETWPIMAVWPQRIGNDWSEYYILWENAATTKGSVTLEVDNVRDLVNPRRDSGARSMLGNVAIRKTNPVVVKTNYVPDAVPLVKRESGQYVSVGMVMPKTVPAYQGLRTVVANVAVDFGTSSTRVFASIDGNPPQEIKVMDIASEPKQVILYKGDATKMAEVTKVFVKPMSTIGGRGQVRSVEDIKDTEKERAERWKRLGNREEIRKAIEERAENTLFSVFRKSNSNLEMEDVAPLLDGNIYQPTNLETAEDNGKCLIANLKWDMAGKGKYYIAFMKQLLLLITVKLNGEGVRQVNWKYSLPRSMPEQGKKTMRRIWAQDMGDYLNQISGRTLSHDIAEQEVTESVAASRYFLARYPEMMNGGKGFLVVDIGGGSTDAALWQTKNGQLSMVWQDSVTVAGQKMCTKWVEERIKNIRDAMNKHTEEHKTVFSNLVDAIPPARDKQRRETRAVLIDRLLTYYSDEMISSFWSESEENAAGWPLKLYSRIAQGPSLMMFCLGCQVGLLHASGRFFIDKGEYGYFTIALGGRGAGIMDWLERLDWLPYSQEKAAKTLASFFCRGMKFGESLLLPLLPENATAGTRNDADQRIWTPDGNRGNSADGFDESVVRVIRNTEDPKCEVAYGLLVTEFGGEQDATRDPDKTTRLLTKDYAKLAADEFRKEFQRVFQSGGDGPRVEIPEIDPHKLASLVQKKIPSYGANMNDIFRILMEAGYQHLAGEQETDG